MDPVGLLLSLVINIVAAIIIGISGFIRKALLTRRAVKSYSPELSEEFSNVWKDFLVAKDCSQYQDYLRRTNSLLSKYPDDKEIEFLKIKILEAIAKARHPIILILVCLAVGLLTGNAGYTCARRLRLWKRHGQRQLDLKDGPFARILYQLAAKLEVARGCEQLFSV